MDNAEVLWPHLQGVPERGIPLGLLVSVLLWLNLGSGPSVQTRMHYKVHDRESQTKELRRNHCVLLIYPQNLEGASKTHTSNAAKNWPKEMRSAFYRMS